MWPGAAEEDTPAFYFCNTGIVRQTPYMSRCIYIHTCVCLLSSTKQKQTASVKTVQLNLIEDLRSQEPTEFKVLGAPPLNSTRICG